MVAREVMGIDSSPSMVQATQQRGLNTVLMSAESITYKNKFDAVFSNAALHWMSNFESVIKGVYGSLKPRGRFVGEFGGHGNISTLSEAMETVISQNEKMGVFTNPWFFPQADEYKSYLENNGFSVSYIELIPRPTPLKTGVIEWLKIFGNYLVSGMPTEAETNFLEQTEQLVKPILYTEEKGWVADYVRLRFSAIKV